MGFVDLDRIVLKIILTGYPQCVSKSKATVRYIFHNPKDVKWFKSIEVYTKCGHRGRIREPVGAHEAMKCLFNGVHQQHDKIYEFVQANLSQVASTMISITKCFGFTEKWAFKTTVPLEHKLNTGQISCLLQKGMKL